MTETGKNKEKKNDKTCRMGNTGCHRWLNFFVPVTVESDKYLL